MRQDDKKKEPVPANNSAERPLLGIKTSKNYVSQNAIDAIMAVPKKPERNFVDTRYGSKFSLDPSGLVPVYVRKKVRNRHTKKALFLFLQLKFNSYKQKRILVEFQNTLWSVKTSRCELDKSTKRT